MPTSKQHYLKNLIEIWGFECKMEYKIEKMTVDLFVPEHNLVIEIDGLNHISNTRNQSNDLKTHLKNQFIKDSNLNLLNYRIEHFREKQKEKEFIKELYQVLHHQSV